MEKIILSTNIREKGEKLKEMRNSKIIPCVVYGRKQEPISLKVNNSDLLRAYRNAGESTIINLKVGKKNIEAVFHDIQKHPVKGDFLHVDFFAITRGEKMTTKITINFIGESPAKKEGAIIEEILKELEIKCLPKDLVEHFEVNLGDLKNIGDSIKIKDLDIDEKKYEVLNNINDVIVSASQAKKEIEVEETNEEEIDEKETNEKETNEEK